MGHCRMCDEDELGAGYGYGGVLSSIRGLSQHDDTRGERHRDRWARVVSNHRPLACEALAFILPTTVNNLQMSRFLTIWARSDEGS